MSNIKAEQKLADQKLVEQVDALPKSLQPKRDLWVGIERAIQDKPQLTTLSEATKSRTMPLAWAASVLAAVLLTWVTLVPSSTDSPAMLVNQMQQGFEQQKQAMLVTYGQPKLSELPTALKKQLDDLVSARQSVEKALQEDPSNQDLLNILRWTQDQELELITQLYSPKWQTI
jgi:hypothetical protein